MFHKIACLIWETNILSLYKYFLNVALVFNMLFEN